MFLYVMSTPIDAVEHIIEVPEVSVLGVAIQNRDIRGVRALCGSLPIGTSGWGSVGTQRADRAHLQCKTCDDAVLATPDRVLRVDEDLTTGLSALGDPDIRAFLTAKLDRDDGIRANAVATVIAGEHARFIHVFDRLTLALDSLNAIAMTERGARHAQDIAKAAIRIDTDLAVGPISEEAK